MSDTSDAAGAGETAQLIPDGEMVPQDNGDDDGEDQEPDVTDPAKLIRLGTMLQTMLVELKETDNDEAGVARLAQIHSETVDELGGILSDDLHEELLEFNDCCSGGTPTQAEMRVAHAQLVGWIQGLLRGMQATATAQAQMAQQQMMMMQEQMKRRALGQGQVPGQPRDPGATVPDSGYL